MPPNLYAVPRRHGDSRARARGVSCQVLSGIVATANRVAIVAPTGRHEVWYRSNSYDWHVREVDMKTAYDVIIVGARCAGSPTAMLLARKGYRVLVVDRADVPERYGVLACGAPDGRRGSRPMGTARSAGGNRMSADSHVRVRFRSLHALRIARHHRDASRVLRQADRTRQIARRRGG